MCTAISYRSEGSYFGRNLDLDRGYGERVVITPRNFEFKMRCSTDICRHYAMIGMATVIDGYPLYFEATNEKGLSMAGLNFPKNASYAHRHKRRVKLTRGSTLIYRSIWNFCSRTHFHAPHLPGLPADGPGSLMGIPRYYFRSMRFCIYYHLCYPFVNISIKITLFSS